MTEEEDLKKDESNRLKSGFSSSSFAQKVPTILSGDDNGVPVYSEVRVLDEQAVLELEDQIAMEEKMEYNQKQMSEATLIG